MSGTAPYEVTVTGTDDETFLFAVPFEMQDGSAFPWVDYDVEYSIPGHMLLTKENGVSIVGDEVVFRDPSNRRLRPKTYEHGCRVRHLTTGDEFQVFDGTVVIGQGNFR